MSNRGQVRDWKIYEHFIASMQSEHATDSITVIPNAKLVGCITGTERQIDVLIDARVEEDVSRRIIVDAKYRRRKIDVTDVEAFEGMLRDCRAERGVIVCSSGYSEAALRRAQAAITIRLVPLEDLESVDLTAWDSCMGSCSNSRSRRKQRGWVLYDQPFGLAGGASALSVVAIGKCDGCNDFHVWCWECAAKFALATEDEHHCGCKRFWLTAVEQEGMDELGNRLEAVLLLLVEPRTLATLVVDRRPLR